MLLSGCMLNGGGFITGTGGGNAKFGFTYTDCGSGPNNHCWGPPRLTGAYEDRTAAGYTGGVRMTINGLVASFQAGLPCIDARANYLSQNPNYPNTGGSQVVQIRGCDNNEPNQGADTLEVNVQSGPFSGYDTGNRDVRGGNLQIKP